VAASEAEELASFGKVDVGHGFFESLPLAERFPGFLFEVSQGFRVWFADRGAEEETEDHAGEEDGPEIFAGDLVRFVCGVVDGGERASGPMVNCLLVCLVSDIGGLCHGKRVRIPLGHGLCLSGFFFAGQVR